MPAEEMQARNTSNETKRYCRDEERMMIMTLEELEKQYEGREEDEKWFYLQAVLGTQADADSAYDEDGKFNCIDWFDCSFCPAFNSKYCI